MPVQDNAHALPGPRQQRQSNAARRGPRALALQLKQQVSDDHLTVVAAGVAFYGLLAAFPALAALVSIYGLVFDAQQIGEQVASLGTVLPPEAAQLIGAQLEQLNQTDRGALGLGFAGSLLLALWSSSAGVRALMKALNIAYDVEEKRGFIAIVLRSLLLALGAIFVVIVAIVAIVVLPALSGVFELPETLAAAIAWLRWPIIALAFWVGLVLLYRWGPCRDRASWSWLNWGASVAVPLWLIGSASFSWYVGNFGNYNKTYGSMGAVVILLMWLLLSAWSVLIGAEINATLRNTRSTRERAANNK